jgi:hypothetical protein
MTAFNDAQENRRAQEKAQREADLNEILFPLKAQQTALELDKLQMEVERGAMTNQIYRKALRQSHSGQMEGLRDIDRNVSGGNGSFKSQYGFGLGIKPQTNPAARPKVSWKIVTPAAPAIPQTGP